MLKNLEKTPWPWFGGKADAAPAVWEALGDVHHYVEPFAGSLAVLMRRPHPANRAYHSETVNDIDGLLVNAWRAMRADPRGMADAASWPVSEADLMARHLALLAWRDAGNLERLMADPEWYDAKMAGWWAWGQSCWIGSGWCSGTGPWVVGADGRVTKRAKSESGRRGGVARQIPLLASNGQGVSHPSARAPGVSAQLPSLSDDGRCVVSAAMREPGVAEFDEGDFVNEETEFHPMTMPELVRWFEFLSARLRHVRVLNGDWRRCLTDSAAKTLSVRQKAGAYAGIFFDPPYDDSRSTGVYTHDSTSVSGDVRKWCVDHGSDPKFRVVLAGYDTEHAELEAYGWHCVSWYRGGYLRGGMRNTGNLNTQSTRERLWLSPHCVMPEGAAPVASRKSASARTSADRMASLRKRASSPSG